MQLVICICQVVWNSQNWLYQNLSKRFWQSFKNALNCLKCAFLFTLKTNIWSNKEFRSKLRNYLYLKIMVRYLRGHTIIVIFWKISALFWKESTCFCRFWRNIWLFFVGQIYNSNKESGCVRTCCSMERFWPQNYRKRQSVKCHFQWNYFYFLTFSKKAIFIL